ncbi:hypothetical protein [Pannus brasiliensis]|uniref:hypothetical protein n=1 Tax=Pannus brasiliensis TaxID=1579216 RepID=UPI002FCDB4EF
MNKALKASYGELYEEDADYTTSLEDTLREILGLFQSNNPIGHLRYVWMALILSLTVQPTLAYYQPDNPLPDYTINRMIVWLIETLEEILSLTEKTSLIKKCNNINELRDDFFSCKTTKAIPSLQILSEALDVYQNAIKTIEPDRSLEALLEILEDCLEGYAIFPGSRGRRELFNWWLLDVVPASWYLRPPRSFYSVTDSPRDQEIFSDRMQELQRISDTIRPFPDILRLHAL